MYFDTTTAKVLQLVSLFPTKRKEIRQKITSLLQFADLFPNMMFSLDGKTKFWGVLRSKQHWVSDCRLTVDVCGWRAEEIQSWAEIYYKCESEALEVHNFKQRNGYRHYWSSSWEILSVSKDVSDVFSWLIPAFLRELPEHASSRSFWRKSSQHFKVTRRKFIM